MRARSCLCVKVGNRVLAAMQLCRTPHGMSSLHATAGCRCAVLLHGVTAGHRRGSGTGILLGAVQQTVLSSSARAVAGTVAGDAAV